MKTARTTLSVWILVVWTLVVWVSRVRNVLIDADLDSGQRFVRLLLPVLFVSSAGIAAFALFSGRIRRSWAPTALALVSVVIWPIRAVQILLQDWDASFKVVHSILATVSVGLGLWVLLASGDLKKRWIQSRASPSVQAGNL